MLIGFVIYSVIFRMLRIKFIKEFYSKWGEKVSISKEVMEINVHDAQHCVWIVLFAN